MEKLRLETLTSSFMMMVDVSEKDATEILWKDSSVGGKYKKHEVLKFADKPVGYLADHFILRIHTTLNSKDYFLKAIPKNIGKRAEYLDETGFFSKECQVYQIMIPELQKCSSLSWAPRCFLAKDGDFIVMEILSDFKIVPSKNLTFDFEHTKVAAVSLAVFHASSLIFEHKTGKKIEEIFKEMLYETAYPLSPPGHIRRKGLKKATEVLTGLIKLIPAYRDSEHLPVILEKFPKTIREIYEFSMPSKVYRNVASHGDLWVNNFMFKYDNEKPVACKLVDFQLARFSPPALELVQLVYINTTQEFRDLHLDDVLNTYCDTFESELKKAGVNPAVLPRSEILESFKEYYLAGLIETVLFGHVTLLPPNLGANFLSSSEEYDKFVNQSRFDTCLKAFEEDYYRDRLTEVLSEMIENFIVKTV